MKSIFETQRGRIAAELDLCNKAEELMRGFSASVLEKVAFSPGWIQICSPTREDVIEILGRLSAGKWTKQITSEKHPDRIDYEGYVSGVRFVLHCSEPPSSCRIEEEVIDVPAHQEIKRKLICS